MDSLQEARNKINSIDKEMAELFEERMICAGNIAHYKKKSGLQIEDKQREKKLIEENSKNIKNKEILPYYMNFLDQVLKVSKSYQKRLISGMQIAVSGSKGAFADIIASKTFDNAENVAFSDFESAYNSTQNGETDFAFLPIENSFGGDVGTVLDLAFFGDLFINGIFESAIIQNLVGVKDADISDIKTVISHPQALKQCKNFILKNCFETRETPSTTTAVKTVFEMNDKSVGAIASEKAANENGLIIIKSHINDSLDNTTRFAVFSKTPKEKNDTDNRFVLMFTVKNTAGALSKAISVIGDYGFNLLDLKSRPTGIRKFNHYFYIEGEGNIFSEKAELMIKDLKKCCDNFKIVGSFQNEIRV